MRCYLHHRRAFTLVELLVAISIIAALAALIFPVFSAARGRARQATCVSNERQLGEAMLLYAHDYDERYPLAMTRQYPWTYCVKPYIRSEDVYRCPTWNNPSLFTGFSTLNGESIPAQVSYIYNINMGGLFISPAIHRPNTQAVNRTMAEVERPAGTVMLTDGATTATVDAPPSQWKQKSYFALISVLLADAAVSGVTTPDANGPAAPAACHSDATNVLFADGHVKALRIEAFFTLPKKRVTVNAMPGYSPCLDPLRGCLE